MSQQLLAPQTEGAAPTIPADIDSPSSKLVYLYLRTRGECTVDELQSSLGMRKISLYPLLEGLATKGLVDRDGETYRPA
jgi:predicted transcriptional regulator